MATPKWLRLPHPRPPPTDHPVLSLLPQAQQEHLRALHARAVTSGLIADTFAASRIVQHFLPLDLRYAESIFDSLQQPDAYTWNAMIAGHISHSSPPRRCVSFYFRMRAAGPRAPPNSYSFALMLKSCIVSTEKQQTATARLVHGQVLKCGFEDDIIIKNSLMRMYINMGLLATDARSLFDTSVFLDAVSWNTMVSAYGKSGDMTTARELFDRMPERNLVSWSALLDGYVGVGDSSEALRAFRRMQEDGIRPDSVALVSVLKACARSGALEDGRAIHRYIDRSDLGIGRNVVLATALVDMYCKCGCIDEAAEVFSGVGDGDVVLWNAMVGGLAMHGDSKRALEHFEMMKRRGVAPNGSTYVGVLCACTHAGMLDEGIELFESMREHGIEPDRSHYGCLADLMGRAGRVRDAERVLLTMPMEPEATQWGALMSACLAVKDVEVGERVGKRLIELEPYDGGRRISLANLYAAVGRYDEARELRRGMEEMGVRKETGRSITV